MLNAINVKLQKLARLARDPAATKGESANAATMLFQIGRKNHIDLAAYSDLLAKVAASESKPSRPHPCPHKTDSQPSPQPQHSEPPWPKPPSSESPNFTPKPPPFPRPWGSTSPFATPPHTKPGWPKPPRPRKPRSQPPRPKSHYSESPRPKPPSSKPPVFTPKPPPRPGPMPFDQFEDKPFEPWVPPPYTRPWDAPPVERPSASRSWDSDPLDSTSPYTSAWYARLAGRKSPRSKPKQKKPYPLLSVMQKGRYRGKTFEEIFQLDPDYLVWIVKAYRSRTILTASIAAFLKSKQTSTNPF